MEGILSQEEINALLSGADIDSSEEEVIEEAKYEPSFKLDKDEEDAIGEVG